MAQLPDLKFGIKAIDQASKPLKKVRGEVDKTQKSHRNLKPVLLGAAAGFAAVGAAAAKALTEFAEYEKSLNRLNTNLKLIGVTSKAAQREFANIATEIQNVTTLSDGAALEIQSMFLSLGAAPEQVKLAVQTTADVAAATGRSVEEIGRQIAKTFGGYAGELGETIPALKELTQEQLRAGEALGLLSDRFGGAASEEVKTLAGSYAQLKNSLSDVLKIFGSMIAEGTNIGGFFQFITDKVNGLVLALGGGTEEQRLSRQLAKLQEEFGAIETFGPVNIGARQRMAGMEPRTLQKVEAEIEKVRDRLVEVRNERSKSLRIAQEQFKIQQDSAKALKENTMSAKEIAKHEAEQLKLAKDRLKYIDGVAKRYNEIQDRKKQMAEFDRMQRQTQTFGAVQSGLSGNAGALAGNITQLAGGSAAMASMVSGITELVRNAKQLPGLIDGMMQGLMEGMVEGIPVLIEYLSGDFIATLMSDFIPALVENMFRLVPALVGGIIKGVGELIANLPNLVVGIGKGIVTGLADGFTSALKNIGGLFGFGGDDRSPQEKLNDTIRNLNDVFKSLQDTLIETTNEIRFSLKGTGGQISQRKGEFNRLVRSRRSLNREFKEAGRSGDTERAAEIVQEIAANQKEQLQKAQSLFALENRRLDEIFKAEKEIFDQRMQTTEAEKQAAQQLISEYQSLKDRALSAFSSLRENIIGSQLGPQANVSRLQDAFSSANSPEAKAQAAEALAGGLQARLAQARSLAQQGAITGEDFRRIQEDILKQLETAESETVSEFDRLISEQQKVVERSDQQIKVLERGFERFEQGIERQREDLERYFTQMIDRLDAIYVGGGGSANDYWTDRSYTENRYNRRGRLGSSRN